MKNFRTMEGSRGLTLEEVRHVLVPGRGRIEGRLLSRQSKARVEMGTNFYRARHLDGKMVLCGYKTPFDIEGEPHRPDGSGREYIGIPEADLMAAHARKLGMLAARLSIERNSISTITNLVYAEHEELFGRKDHDPVAIVAQSAHLERIIHDIAPKTLRRDYIGVVVSEQPGFSDYEKKIHRALSRVVLVGMYPDHPRIYDITTRRVDRAWRRMRDLQKIKNALGGMATKSQRVYAV